MRLLDRYLLRELLVPLGYCLGGFLIIWISSELLGDLGQFYAHRLRAGDVAQYYLVRVPEFLVLVFPMGLLLALLFALTAHARHHEITAIRAAGVSLWRLAAPYFAVGLLGSVLMFVLNEWWVPDINDRAERILNRRATKNTDPEERYIARNFGFTSTAGGTICTWLVGAYDQRTAEMHKLQLDLARSDGTRRWLSSERALFANGVWTLYSVAEFRENPAQAVGLTPSLRTNQLALPELTVTPEEIRSEIKISRRLRLRSARSVDLPISEILDYLRLHPNPARSDRRWLYTKFHGRLALPWMSLVVVVIALPFGAVAGRRNVFAGVAGSILICFTYYVTQQLSLALGVAGILPSWLAGWLPNLLFGAAGAWLTSRVR